MLSKQAFNALLKTLEEPPEYLKFIFATTEIKKIPITVVSRCQRFDLSRIKSSELLEFIKTIKEKENAKVSDEAIKLIVKISEGSVRDALSLLDRGILALDNNQELDLKLAQKIFGYFDKSQLINLFQLILKGDQSDGVPNVLSNDDCFVEGIRQTPMRQTSIDKLTEDIKAMGDEVYRNYCRNKKLIDLEETPSSVKSKILNSFEEQDKWNNRGKVFPYFVEKRCRMLLEDIEDFI